MLRYFGLTSEYPFLGFLGEIVYYLLVCAAILLVFRAFYQRLTASGHDKKRLRFFLVVFTAVGFPAGFLGSRAAGLFQQPVGDWSIALFLDSLGSRGTHTFHASIILPIVIFSILILVWRYRYLEVMDTMFLYLPVGHAIGRVACLIVGCCWGRSVTLELWGFHTRFVNPSPLFSILLNVSIFYFLKRLYEKTYLDHDTQKRYEGSIVASYLLLYGVGRAVLEIFRRERRVLFELSQAQVVMVLFVVAALVIFWIIDRRSRRAPDTQRIDGETSRAVTKLFSLMGLVACYLAFLFVMHYLTLRLLILPTPFHRAESLGDAYLRIVGYLPILSLPLLSVYWLRRADLPISEKFEWKSFSRVFYVALAVSIYYSIELLVLKEPRLRGLGYWPAVVILSAMNATSEETVHRLGIFGLLRSADYSRWAAIIMQSLLYSIVHFAISPTFGLLSFFYGLLLGILMDRSRSVTPCIICHFFIDIGGIGKPLLSY